MASPRSRIDPGRRAGAVCGAAILLSLLSGPLTAAPSAAARAEPPPLLLGPAYPIEVRVDFHSGLFHWLDSLTGVDGPGMTAGKTVAVHREEYARRFGPVDTDDHRILQGWVDARWHFARGADPGRRHDLTRVFFEAHALDEALDAAAAMLEDGHATALRAALQRFAPRYREIWNDGAVPQRFLQRAAADKRRRPLGRFMVRMAEFYGVPIDPRAVPRLVLVPVPPGAGTHAQAVGPNLLIELRHWEGLADEVAPIVHENAHFLYHRIDAERRDALRDKAATLGEHGLEAWYVLLEALPTALGQGVAAERFQRRRWNRLGGWYHTEPVDRYAKAIFPLVRKTLARGGRFDEAFLERVIPLYAATRR